VIANNVNVSYSVIGDGCHIRDGACIQYSVLYPGAFVACSFLNCSFMGRDTFIGDGTTLTDFRFDGKNVTVLKDGVSVDSGNMFLGGCLGHGVYVGSGVILAPGREIPNNVKLLPAGNMIVSRFPPPKETFQTIHSGEA